MTDRGPFTGTWRVVRFNWPLYAVALAVAVGGVGTLVVADTVLARIAAWGALAGALWFLGGSLLASHLVYDRSDLHRGRWLARAWPQRPQHVAICHCGYDEVSALVRDTLSPASMTLLDHYAEATMSEPSIRRARRLFPPAPGTLTAPHTAWPTADGAFDAVLGALAIHELRSAADRAAWFSEARRCLTRDGRIVLVEHLRDAANFMAFGPGFVHFHSAATWRRAWESAGLSCADSFRITPFVRVFVLRPHD